MYVLILAKADEKVKQRSEEGMRKLYPVAAKKAKGIIISHPFIVMLQIKTPITQGLSLTLSNIEHKMS